MAFSLTIFILSGAGIIALLGFKMLQEKLGLLLFWPDIRVKIEVFLQEKKSRFQRFIAGFNSQNFYKILHITLTKIRLAFIYVQQKIDKKLLRLINLIRGKHISASKTPASPFLHDITKHCKETFKK